MTLLLALAAAVSWIPAQDARFTVNGLPWLAENKGEMIRLPRRLEPVLPKAVWNLGLSPSGGRIRFRTNSTRIAIRLEYPSAPNMANMHAFGQTGVDLYLNGVYRSTAIAPKDAAPGKSVEHIFVENLDTQMRDVVLYLPLYKPVTVQSIGLDEGATVDRPRRFAVAKPVVYYGTSITQGGCASRSGMSYQAILARQLNLDFVNLGFSGNGKGEPVVASMVAELDPSLFVLDFSQNNPTIESVREVYEPFLRTLRAKHPDTPVLAITPIANLRSGDRFVAYAEHIRGVIRRHIAAGDRRLSLVEGHSLLGNHQLDGLVDGSHPNDLGFQWMADALAPHIAHILHIAPPKLVDDREIRATPDTAGALREKLTTFIWGSPGLPSGLPAKVTKEAAAPAPAIRSAAATERFDIAMSNGQRNVTYHLTPARPNGALIVLHHGHSCSFSDGAGVDAAAEAFLAAGYSVLLGHMPHFRPEDCRQSAHGDIFDLPLSSGSGLRYFLEPVAFSLNRLRPQYRAIHMAGLSGGGWTTTVYAAIDPSIRYSFPVAGTMPLYLRANGSTGDEEQWMAPFYRLAGYPDLYLLGASGPGRKQVQILNRRDDCCFGEAQHGVAYSAQVREYSARVTQAAPTYRLVIDEEAPKHMISPFAIRLMLQELAK